MSFRSIFFNLLLLGFLAIFFGFIFRPHQKIDTDPSQIIEGKKGDLNYYLTVFGNPKKGLRRSLILVLHPTGGKGDTHLKLWKKEADRHGIMVTADAPGRTPEQQHRAGNLVTSLEILLVQIEVDTKGRAVILADGMNGFGIAEAAHVFAQRLLVEEA